MRSKARTYLRFLGIFAVIGALGIAAAIYTLIHERVTLPFQSLYTVKAEFTAANGVAGGLGQPVQVVGVNVGQITGISLDAGTAVVTMQLQRDQLPRVYADATAALEPVTALNDMAIQLDPGHPPAAALQDGSTIPVAQTKAPVPLSDLLSRLDADTRDYLASLIDSVAQGTGNRGPDLRRMMRALGPTTEQVGAISHALAARRTQLASFVTNLAALSHAVSQDGEVPRVISAGEQTLAAVASQDAAVRQSLRGLPPALALTKDTLSRLTPFANQLGPTLRSLLPAVNRLPAILRQIGSFSNLGTQVVRTQVRPLVREAKPLLAAAAPAVVNLNRAAPALTGVAQTLDYLLNELGFVAGGHDQGYLAWTDWAFHNLDSLVSTGDATGSVVRGLVVLDCAELQGAAALPPQLALFQLCPK